MKIQFLIVISLVIVCLVIVSTLGITVKQNMWVLVNFETRFISDQLVPGTTFRAATTACHMIEGCHTVCRKEPKKYYISESTVGPHYCAESIQIGGVANCWTSIKGSYDIHENLSNNVAICKLCIVSWILKV